MNEYFQLLLYLAGAVVLAVIVRYVLANFIRKIAGKTKTDIDDKILKIITKPLFFYIIFLGIYLGLKALSLLNSYTIWADRIFFIISVLFASYVISRILSVLISYWLKVQKKFVKTPKLITRIIVVVIYLIAILMIFDYFDVEITPLVATLGIGGLAVGLALQNTLTNFFAGLHIITDRPINVGDYIELEKTIKGYVEDIGWRSTRLKTVQGNLIIVPNSKLAESVITNISLPEKAVTITIPCGVAYDSDLEKVEKVTLKTLKGLQEKVEGLVEDFEPSIRFHTFGESNIDFSIFVKVESRDFKYPVTHELIKALKKVYDKEKIEISWPVRKVYMSKE